MKKEKAFIFDLDGVIVDTAKYHFLAWRNLANELGFEFTEEHKRKVSEKMLGVKPKNGKFGIFGSITMAAINKYKAGANDKTKIDPKTGLPYDTVGAMRDKLPNADTTTNSNTKTNTTRCYNHRFIHNNQYTRT